MRCSMLGVYLVPEKTFDPKTDSQPARKSETLARKLVKCRANVNDVGPASRQRASQSLLFATYREQRHSWPPNPEPLDLPKSPSVADLQKIVCVISPSNHARPLFPVHLLLLQERKPFLTVPVSSFPICATGVLLVSPFVLFQWCWSHRWFCVEPGDLYGLCLICLWEAKLLA